MSPTKPQAARKDYITILSVLAGFAVVALHANSFWLFRKSESWVLANVIECLFYFAVPVFFMITGATLLDYRKRYTTKEFLLRRAKRTVVPFLAWSIIGAVVYFARGGEWSGIRGLISGILNCEFVGIFWFFPALFAVYLIIPLLSLIPESKRKTGFGYAIMMGFGLNTLLPLAANLLDIQYSGGFVFPLVGYTLYALLGYWIANYPISSKNRKIVYVCGILGLIVHFGGTWFLSYKIGTIDMTFKDYLNVPCMLYSVAIFVLFKHIQCSSRIIKIAKILSPLTYGVYLVQFFILQIYHDIIGMEIYNFAITLLATPCVYVICLGVVFVISKTPLLKRLV